MKRRAYQHRYQIYKNELDPPPPTYHATCMDAFSCCWENEVVLRDGKLVQNPTRVACYEFDIIDLKESIESGDASQQLKEFIKAYEHAERLPSVVLHLPPVVMHRLKVMAQHYNKTAEEIIALLLRPYFTNLED